MNLRSAKLITAVCMTGLFLQVACADQTTLKIQHAWIQALPPSSEDTAAFMTISNPGKESCRLTGATTPIAARVMPMITTRKTINGDEVLGMKAVKFLEIPAGGSLALKPGGNHLMLMKLKDHPKPGEKVPLTLQIEPGNRRITIEVPVTMREENTDHE